VTDVYDYARAEATEDVRAALDWLVAGGFAVTETSGGPQHGFGDLSLRLVRGSVDVTIVRDRGQWMCSIAGRYLEDLLTEMGERIPEVPFEAPLPRQLPPDVRWREALPSVLASMGEGAQ
jgi:hypothetical protein